MKRKFATTTTLPHIPLWQQLGEKRIPFAFDLEVTARCNNACRHCYINLPANDKAAHKKEMTIDEIARIADQAAALGSLWCLLTGGEPLLRADFGDIYLMLKKKGLLVSLFTNACLVTAEHINLLKKYPPRDIEVTVYGVTRETYEGVTRRPGSFAAFQRGLDLLLKNNFRVRLKAMALRTNLHELPAIAAFCRSHTADHFRFDPLLHLRYDGNGERNQEIGGERLGPGEIVALEQGDAERSGLLEKNCSHYIFSDHDHKDCRHLFYCGAGNAGFTVSPEGIFRLCSSLWHPDCVYDLKKGTLADAWNNFVPRVRDRSSADLDFLKKCHSCSIINLCLWCPAHAHLESGRLDAWCEYFCQVAHARAAAVKPQDPS